jgi:hypothetical protein
MIIVNVEMKQFLIHDFPFGLFIVIIAKWGCVCKRVNSKSYQLSMIQIFQNAYLQKRVLRNSLKKKVYRKCLVDHSISGEGSGEKGNK